MQHKVIWHSFDGKLALTAANLVLIYKEGKWYHTDSPRWLQRVEFLREAEETEKAIERRRNRRHGQ